MNTTSGNFGLIVRLTLLTCKATALSPRTIKLGLKRDKSIKTNYTLFAKLILYQTWLQNRINIDFWSGSLFRLNYSVLSFN